MNRITQAPGNWQLGYNAGMSGGPSAPPPEISDRLAYAAGYVEGVAAKARADAARGDQPDAGRER